MPKIRKEKSMIGKIDDMSRNLMIMLVIPIFISLILMLVYEERYHSAIARMETIASLKAVVNDDIPGSVWDIVSGRDTIQESRVYAKINGVYETIDEVIEKTDEDKKLSLIVAGRTMETLENYVDQIRDNLKTKQPVVENEEVLAEIRGVASLVDSMLNEYIAQVIEESADMSLILRPLVLLTAFLEAGVVLYAWFLRNRSLRRTIAFVKQPIDRLEEAMAAIAEGSLDTRITDTDVAELRNLTLSVNIMADKLEDMMKKSIKDERNLRKAELRTLQTQINPHFLYNTLDAIIWKAEAGEKDEVISLTSALSDFFRISLSSGADWIPISQEKKHIEGYLRIQQTRYRDILRYEIDIPEEIGHYYILKLLLQPLVENAIYHGIKIKRGGGLIRVTARLVDDMFEFAVSDTGTGMTEEQLKELNERMKKGQPTVSEGSGGFGMVNVNLRIRLYYNQPEGLKIESSNEGTTVSFRVPCKSKEEISEDESISG